MTVVLFPSSSNMYQTMLRQLLWICIISILKSTIALEDYFANPDFDQCGSRHCKPIDEMLKENIDFDREPCDDFYKYACGKNYTWGTSAQREISAIFSREPEVTEIKEMASLRNILDQPFLDEYENNIAVFRLERKIYAQCKKAEKINSYYNDQKRAYEETLAKYGANRLDANYIPKSYDKPKWSDVDLEYALEGIGFAFFDVDIVDIDEPGIIDKITKRYIQISPTSDQVTELIDLIWSRYQSASAEDRSASEYNYNGGGEKVTHRDDKKYADLRNFIIKLNQIIPANDKLEEYHTPINISSWNEFYNSYVYNNYKLDWTALLQRLFESVGDYKINGGEDIIVKNQEYFRKLADLLHETDNFDTIVNYIHLRFISKTIGLAYKQYQDKYTMIPAIKGLTCTPGLLVGTAHVYVRRYFPKDNRDTVEAIFEALKHHIQFQLGSNERDFEAMSETTKIFLRELKHAKVVSGYPEWVANETAISKFYENFVISEKYHVNQIRFLQILMKNKLRTYRNGYPLIDMNLFFKSFTLDKIEYSNNLKEIVVPATGFSENGYKFLGSLLFDPINYGAAGTAMASAIYRQWLNKIKYVNNPPQCLTREINTDANNREQYLLQATSYVLGLNASYQMWDSKGSYPIQFPKFGAITDYRLFFLVFAQSMCGAPTHGHDIAAYNFINIAVANSHGFQKAFRCYNNHRLYRQPLCDPLVNYNKPDHVPIPKRNRLF